MYGISDGSGSNRRSAGWQKRWISEQLKALWMIQAMDQGAIEGAMDSASDESVNKSRSNGCYKRWIVEHLKERWMSQALDQ